MPKAVAAPRDSKGMLQQVTETFVYQDQRNQVFAVHSELALCIFLPVSLGPVRERTGSVEARSSLSHNDLDYVGDTNKASCSIFIYSM